LGTLGGNLKIGAINALGERRDRAATGPLAALLAGSDEAMACAAASALGKIGGDAAAAELQKALARSKGRLRTETAHACLACADLMLAEKKVDQAAAIYALLSAPSETQSVRMAALRGTVLSRPEKAASVVCKALTSGDAALESMAIQLVPAVPGPAASEEFAACLGKTPPPVRALLIGALAARRDAAVRRAIEAAASSDDPAVRLAALKALGTCGDETTVKALADRLVAGGQAAEAEAARMSLVRLRGPGVNGALADMISRPDARAKDELIRILAARNAAGVTAALKKGAEDPDPAVRKESWKALGSLAKGQEADALVDLCVRVRQEDRDDAERATAVVVKRAAEPGLRAVLHKLDAPQAPAARAAILRIVSAVGNDLALPAMRTAIRSDDATVREAAVRGLAAWPTAAPFDDLVALARDAKEPVHRVLALRAAIRLSNKVEGRTPEQMTRLVSQLIQLAREAAERKAVLAELGRCSTPEALHLAEKYLADPELATEAGVAVTQIASALRDSHRNEVLAALRPLLTGRPDPVVAGRACKVLKDILKPVNLALGATATNPDGLAADGAAGGPQAAIDGNPNTYWDEVDGADQYRLRVTFRQPTDVSSINLLWHPFEQHQAKNFDVLCDGKLVKQVRGAKPFENEMFVAFAPVRCTSVELVIPGKNGLVSPCIHEFQIFGGFPPPIVGGVQSSLPPKYKWKQADGVLALENHGRVVWQLNYAANLSKPYFHPVALTDGTVLTAPSPADHP
jgi:HEAT repeat protein